MNNLQLHSIYKKQLGQYLDLIVALGIQDDLIDFGYISKTGRFVFVFKNSAALDIFLLKVLVVTKSNDKKFLPVDFITYRNTLCLTTTEQNG